MHKLRSRTSPPALKAIATALSTNLFQLREHSVDADCREVFQASRSPELGKAWCLEERDGGEVAQPERRLRARLVARRLQSGQLWCRCKKAALWPLGRPSGSLLLAGSLWMPQRCRACHREGQGRVQATCVTQHCAALVNKHLS